MSKRSQTCGDVEKQLSFALYGAANRVVRMHRPFLEPLSLTFPQYLVILALLDVTSASVGAIGAKLGMDNSTVTPLLKRMEKSELLARRRDIDDERRVLVELTLAGCALRTSVLAVSSRVMGQCQIMDSQADDLRQVLDALGRPADVATCNMPNERAASGELTVS